MDDKTRSAFFNKAGEGGYAGRLGLKLIELIPGHAIVEMVSSGDDANMFKTFPLFLKGDRGHRLIEPMAR